MSETKRQKTYIEKANELLFGKLDSEKGHLILDTDDHLVQCYLKLMSCIGASIKEVDIVKYRESKDPLGYLASTQGVRNYRATLNDGWYKENYGPFLAFTNDEFPKALLMIPGIRGYKQVDPVTGKSCKITKELAENISENVIFCYNGMKTGKNIFLRALFYSFSGNKRTLLSFILLVFAVSAVTLLVPMASSFVIEHYLPTGQATQIVLLCGFVLLSVLASILINVVVNRVRYKMQEKFRTRFFLALWDKILGLPVGTLRKHSAQLIGMLIGVLTSLFTLSNSVFLVCIYAIQCVLAAAQMSVYAGDLSAVTGVFILLYFMAVVIVSIISYRNVKKNTQNIIDLTNVRHEILGAVDTIKTTASEDLFYYQHMLCYAPALKSNVKKRTLQNTAHIIKTIFPSVSLLMIYLAISSGVQIGLSQFVAFSSAFSLFFGYYSMAFGEISNFVVNLPYLQQVKEVLMAQSETYEEATRADNLRGNISINDVSFRYGEDLPYVIKGISLQIKNGEYLAIVGKSGCGKSTLFRLLLGFEEPTAGSVYYDEQNLADAHLPSMRRQFGVVLQNSVLFSGSIKSNITLVNAPMEEIRKAADMAGILEDIEAMPMKFETMVSNESELISGGQKQRIMIARALMNNPRVLFLDEATNALDNKAQKHIKQSLDSLQITRIVVAHRLSTIQNCDRIVVLDEGKIAEEGSYKELMEKNGLFAKMVKRDVWKT